MALIELSAFAQGMLDAAVEATVHAIELNGKKSARCL
jgi:hypothetical protein